MDLSTMSSDPTQILIWLFSQILPHLPAYYAAIVYASGSVIVATASLIIAIWSRNKPDPTSKWYNVYKIIGKIGLNGNHTSITSNKDSTK